MSRLTRLISIGLFLVAAGAAAAAPPSDDTSIRPFKFHASDKALADLKRRIAATRWPEPETVNDATQGVNLPQSFTEELRASFRSLPQRA